MRRRLATVKFGERLPLISGGVAAALAGVMLVVLFGMYLLPFGTMRHGSSVPVDVPTIRAGGTPSTSRRPSWSPSAPITAFTSVPVSCATANCRRP